MSRLARIREMVSRYNLESMIQSGMPGYVITLYTKSGRRQFCGNSAEALAYLEGYGNALYLSDKSNPYYDANDLPQANS